MRLSEPPLLAHFYRTRDQYRKNAEQAIGTREYRKASELLWGAVTQQIKALASAYNVVIESHREFFDFLRQFAGELQDPKLYEDFVALNALHRNFYDEVIPADIFPLYYEKTLEFLSRLDDLLRVKLGAESSG